MTLAPREAVKLVPPVRVKTSNQGLGGALGDDGIAPKFGLASPLVGAGGMFPDGGVLDTAPRWESNKRCFGSTRSMGIVTEGGGLGGAPFSAFCW